MAKKRLYRIQFYSHGKVYQLYARRVGQGELHGFVDVEGLVFDDQSSLVIDPSEERLKAEFEGVGVIHVPLHAVIKGTAFSEALSCNSAMDGVFPSLISEVPQEEMSRDTGQHVVLSGMKGLCS